ncbi:MULTISPECIES: MmgE/PrpD family protein [unclassified Rhodococcus (in: high G+C Gram-positive bacteria)]|uniref:MmgE/PrpD family protein n=1 Tax=unclassified Rhodococcus (in: high G+C Gram-positive bacteria) TaxID=192944 RepID=UPI0006FD1B2E|nr:MULTISPECIES: MmgE/PrpD family protein [unclassified Rhodococcus (in: high G+C Gram-positive bacteria)]KQU28461.1 MmgE/PrpD family protein [Rhodococcus sp. Leaf225]KQU47658.1 MmgE/PrpD family protein [Rhodococcus sp. Leaf258]
MPDDADDVVHHFAHTAANTTFDTLPAGAVEAAKKSILDTLGVILAASGVEPAVRAAIDVVLESGDRPEATVLAYGRRSSAIGAAFANGALAHCLDYDDQTPWGQHASSSIVPAVFAVAERRGGVTGKDLIAAVAVGQDLFARLRCNVGWRKDWNLSTVIGVYAATAAAGRVLGLSSVQLGHALGIASMQSSGVMELVCGTGSDLRGIYAAFSARGAVTAVLLAEKGMTGVDTLFEGEYGVFRTYFDGEYERDAILRGLGIEYLGAGTLYKKWPAVGTAHSHVHAIIGLLEDNDLVVDDLSEIRVFVGDYHDLMCRPLEARQAPATLVDAKFSLPFLVALGAVHKSLKISHFTEESLADDAVLAAARKITPVSDPDLDWTLELPAGRVEIIAHDGRKFERIGTGVPGNEDAPLNWDDLAEKFVDCASVAVSDHTAESLELVVLSVRDLESMNDATALLRMLTVVDKEPVPVDSDSGIRS